MASSIPDVTAVRLFGSRKYHGKLRSDLDLLVEGPHNSVRLLEFRRRHQQYSALDLWLVTGDTATSVVNGSVLNVVDVDSICLYPQPGALSADLTRQSFRADIDFKMTSIPPEGLVRLGHDHLGITQRLPTLLNEDIRLASDCVVQIVGGALNASKRMRSDGQAGRGRGVWPVLKNEYDFQNFTELVLAPIVNIQREPFTIQDKGTSRSADFSLAAGRLIVELKFPKSGGSLAAATKDAEGVLNQYLNHPGVEVAIAVIGVPSDLSPDINAIEQWHSGTLRWSESVYEGAPRADRTHVLTGRWCACLEVPGVEARTAGQLVTVRHSTAWWLRVCAPCRRRCSAPGTVLRVALDTRHVRSSTHKRCSRGTGTRSPCLLSRTASLIGRLGVSAAASRGPGLLNRARPQDCVERSRPGGGSASQVSLRLKTG